MNIKQSFYLMVLATVFFTHASAQQTAKVTSSGIGYLEYLPDGYNSNSNKYPVVISLHGIKERGTTSTDPAVIKTSALKVANVGLPKYVKYGQKYPFILISPQLKSSYGTWPAAYVMEVVNYVKSKLRIDPNRIYLTGLSLGGYGVWTTAGANPSVFAAIAPVCSGGNSLSKACAIAAADLPIWAFHGDKDGTVSYQVSLKMVNAVNACTPKPSPLAKITIYPGLTHIIWDKAYKESTVLDWMLSFRKGITSPGPTAPGNELPIVSAGSDKTVTLPTTSTTIQGSASDGDGTIASYTWSKVSGGTATLSGTTSSKLTASGLAAGSYTFRLSAKDNDGASKSDDVVVTVKSSNTAPIAKAGSDKSITTTGVNIIGSGTDADGYITYYKWKKMSGPYCFMDHVSKSTLVLSSMADGTYSFRLTVTDNKGATGEDYVTVKVQHGTATVIPGREKNVLIPGEALASIYSDSSSPGKLQTARGNRSDKRELFVVGALNDRRRMNAGLEIRA